MHDFDNDWEPKREPAAARDPPMPRGERIGVVCVCALLAPFALAWIGGVVLLLVRFAASGDAVRFLCVVYLGIALPAYALLVFLGRP